MTSYIAIVQYQTRKLTIVQYCSVNCKFCSVFMFLHVFIGLCVHMYVYCSMQFSPCIDFCNSYHNQNTKLFQQRKRTPLCYPFISHTTSTPPTDNHWPLLHLHSLSFQGCCINRIIEYITFWDCFFFHSEEYPWKPFK